MTCVNAYRLQSHEVYRLNIESVLIGYRFLEKLCSLSDFTCTVRIAKIFARISYYVAIGKQKPNSITDFTVKDRCTILTEIYRGVTLI